MADDSLTFHDCRKCEPSILLCFKYTDSQRTLACELDLLRPSDVTGCLYIIAERISADLVSIGNTLIEMFQKEN